METMQAAVLEALGRWKYDKMPVPQCGEDDVIIQTMRSGICSTDVVRSMKTGFYKYPIVPGHEFCGVVVEKGKNVTNVETDDAVAVYPLIPCRKCRPCLMGRFNLCDSYDFLGSRNHGGYAEFVKCPSETMVKIPDGISFEEAAMTEPASVTLHANRISGVGDTVAIMGLGPIGLMAAQWAKVLGAKKVVGVDRHEHRFVVAKQVGVDNCIDTRDKDAVKEIIDMTNGVGADIVFECSGSDDLYSQGLLAAAKGGKIVVLGNPAKSFAIDQAVYSCILRRELTITGSWSSLTSSKEWHEALDAIKAKKKNVLPVITHGFHLSEAAQVIEDMHFKRFEFSKVNFYF